MYTRISSDRDGDRLGVQRQETECRELCDRRHWTVASVYEDDDRSAYSGRTRPHYLALLDAIRAGEIQAVVAWHPDRLHRSPRELEDFIDLIEIHKIKVATVQSGEYDLSTASGRMTARVVGAVARAESEHRSERIRSWHRQRALAGQPAGGGTRPFGYTDNRRRLHPKEAPLVREAVSRFLAGDSLRGICRDWNDRGIPTVAGNEWHPGSMRRMISAALIAGWREHRGVLVAEATWPAIVSLDELHAVRAILSDPARLKRRTSRRYLLTGVAHCALCDALLVARPRGDGRKCYVCATGVAFYGCGKIRVLAEPLDGLVVEAIGEVVSGVDLDLRSTPLDDGLRGEVQEVEERLDELAEMFAHGDINQREWLRAREALDGRLVALSAAEREAVTRNGVLRDVDALRAMVGGWDDLGINRQRSVVESLVERVTVGSAVKGRNFFDPDRVDVTWRV